MSEPLPSIRLLKRAFGDALEADDELLDMIFNRATYNSGVPGTWDQVKPCLEWGIQADTDDIRNGYGQNGIQLMFRLVAHDQGTAPGMWDFERCYEVLERADTVLKATTLAPADGQRVWRVRRTGGIPEMPNEDPDTGLIHIAVGSLYEVRTYKQA